MSVLLCIASYSLNLKSITLFKKIIFVHLVSLDLKYFPIKDLMAAFTDIFNIRVAIASRERVVHIMILGDQDY